MQPSFVWSQLLGGALCDETKKTCVDYSFCPAYLLLPIHLSYHLPITVLTAANQCNWPFIYCCLILKLKGEGKSVLIKSLRARAMNRKRIAHVCYTVQLDSEQL